MNLDDVSQTHDFWNFMNRSPNLPRKDIAIFVHVHYREIWEELSCLIAERIDLPFKLFLTTSLQDIIVRKPDTPQLTTMDVIRVENRGRDILPFMHALAKVQDFDIGLKLHTKKSPQRSDGDAWRNEIYRQLMPANGGVTQLVTAMNADPRVGLVAPDGFSLSVRPWIFGNGPSMKAVMAALGHEMMEDELEDVFFAAGSMFWFRREGLAAFADERLPNLFEAEEGQLDGTVAHAVERLFPVQIRRQGLISTSRTALLAARPGAPLDAIIALARQNADIPNAYFPAAGVAAGADVIQPPPLTPARSLLRLLAGACPARLRRLLRRLLAH